MTAFGEHRLQRERSHLTAEGLTNIAVLVQRPQYEQLLQGLHQNVCRGLVQEVEVEHVMYPQSFQLQHKRAQIAPLDLRSRRFAQLPKDILRGSQKGAGRFRKRRGHSPPLSTRARAERYLCVESVAPPGRFAACAAAALPSRRLGDGRHGQQVDASLGIVQTHLHEAWAAKERVCALSGLRAAGAGGTHVTMATTAATVSAQGLPPTWINDVANAGDGDGGLRDVGGEDGLAVSGLGRLEHVHLLLGRQGGVELQHLQLRALLGQPLQPVLHESVHRLDLLLPGQEDEHVARRLFQVDLQQRRQRRVQDVLLRALRVVHLRPRRRTHRP
eukprot:scaffold1311_cov323-Prasinococcus_capsulatus_cf.AAC.2